MPRSVRPRGPTPNPSPEGEGSRGKPSRDAGFALIGALGALAFFSYVAFATLSAGRGTIAEVGAVREQARLLAGAEAGLAMAVNGLSIADEQARWPIDGRARVVAFDGMRLTIRIEDERGKIRINTIDEAQVRTMFRLAGANGPQLDRLTDALLDWRDTDDERHPNGAEAPDYAARGVRIANGALRTPAELRDIMGMDDRIYARLAPVVTVFPGETAFSPETASIIALKVMTVQGENGVDAITRERELRGQRTALDTQAAPSLIARPVTVRVDIDDGGNGRLSQANVIEFQTAGNWRIRLRL